MPNPYVDGIQDGNKIINLQDVELREKADPTTTSINGNPISISGLKANQLAINPIITLEPIQAGSGTPSPSNVRAISGYDKIEVLSCGKNILEGIIENCAIDSSGLIYASTGTKMGYAKIGQGKTYTVKSDDSTLIGGFFLTKPTVGSTTYNGARIVGAAGNYTFTATITGYIAFRCTSAYTTLQIEEGSTSTTYESPVKTTSISESLGQTVYKGSLDVRTGLFTATYKGIDLGDLTYTYNGGGLGEFAATLSDSKASTSYISNPNAYCSIYEVRSGGYRSAANNTIGVYDKAYANGSVVILDNRYTDATTFKTALAGQKLVYELATPFTIQLTPYEISLLKDYAYVSTNGTSIALDYHNGELASLGDVSQLGETVNNVLNNPSILDVTSKFVANSDNVYSTTLKAFKMGRIVFITGTFHPKALSTFQNKSWFAITDDSLLPVNTVNTVATFTPVETEVSSTVAFPIDVNNTLKEIRTANNGAYGGVTNISTSSLVVCTMMYICKG